MKRRNWRVCPPPKVHGSMVACEEYDRRAYNELKKAMFDYDWKWWDYGRPTKSHDKGSWKSSTKRRHQYRPIAIDLYTPFERDECGVTITDEQVDEMNYLLTHYEFSAVAELVYA